MTDRLGGDPLLLDAVGALACAVLRWQRTLLPSCALSTTWRSFPTQYHLAFISHSLQGNERTWRVSLAMARAMMCDSIDY
jgi:hypothetical protein